MEGADRRVAIVTGGSSGIGAAALAMFRAKGWNAISFSRREGVDATDRAALSAAVEKTVSDFGRIDAIVNNAGSGIFGASERADAGEVGRLFDLNFNAALALSSLAIPHMRRRGCGRIINVASAAAIFPLPFQSVYSASKAALLAWTRALDWEVRRFGIRATAVCPGDVRTGFTAARTPSLDGDDEYGGAIAKALAKANAAENGGQDPSVAARAIVRAATCRNPPLVVVPGAGYAWLDRLSRLLPRAWVSAAVGRIYS